jgi:hypothetical protein
MKMLSMIRFSICKFHFLQIKQEIKEERREGRNKEFALLNS